MGWNRPSEEKKVEVEGKGRQWNGRLKGLVAGAIVVLGAAVAAWWLWPERGTRQDAASTKKGLIKEVKPAVQTNAPAVAETPVDPNADPPGTYRDENGVLRKPGGMRVKDPKRKHVKVELPSWMKKPSVFTNAADREVAALLTVRPGERVYGGHPRYDERFRKQFMEALFSGKQINPDDPPHVKELKEAVYETKREIAQRIRNGENLEDILESARREQKALADCRDSILKELDAVTIGKEMSEEEVTDYIRAANKMLEAKGMRTVNETGFARRWMFYQKRSQQNQQQKEEGK